MADEFQRVGILNLNRRAADSREAKKKVKRKDKGRKEKKRKTSPQVSLLRNHI